MSVEFIRALEQLEKEKGVNKEVLIEAIEAALISAYRKNFGMAQNVKVVVDKTSGDVRVYGVKKVVSEISDQYSEMLLDDAQKINQELQIDDEVEIEVTPKSFGRIAAQTAKQVVMQRIREAERGVIFDEFSNKAGEIVTGVIQRIERKDVYIDLGKAEAVLPFSEQPMREEYKFNDRMKIFILDVQKTNRGPQIIVSRTHPNLVKRLFELEVPEIYNGVVEIKNLAREAGSRTKIAVYSRDENVDPVGACVGQKGSRVQAIVDELMNEKIDIIRWSSDPAEYISSSLSPAKVMRVAIDESERSAEVIVPDNQLSLAIGKEGQNARLAAKLTGWKIDIKSKTQLRTTIEKQLLNFDENYTSEDYDVGSNEEDENIDEA